MTDKTNLPLWHRLNHTLTNQRRLGIAGALTLAYFLALYNLLPLGALHSMMLVVIPVAVMGWFWGPLAGTFASVIGVIINALLIFAVYEQRGLVEFLMAWPGNLLVLLSGYSAGLLGKQISERTRLNLELSSRDRFIQILGLIARDMLDTSSLEERRLRLAEHLKSLLLADYIQLFWWNNTQGKIELLASTNSSQPSEIPFVLEEKQASSSSLCIEPNQLAILGVSPAPRILSLNTLTNLEMPSGAQLVLPIVAGQHRLGMTLAGFEQPRRLAGDEIIFVQMACLQGALALLAIEQEAQIQKQLKEAQTLVQIEQALSKTEIVGLQTLLQLIVTSTQKLIPAAEEVVLHLIDTDNQYLIPRAVIGKQTTPSKRSNLRRGEGIAGLAIVTGQSIYVPDVQTDSRFVQKNEPIQYKSLMTAPIKKSDHQVLGTISIDSRSSHAFTADDERLLNALSVHAAIAIENAHLLETAQQDLQEIRALHYMGSALAATLEPDELFRDTTKLLRELFGFYHIQIFVTDPHKNKLVVRAASGEHAEQILKTGHEIEIGAGIIGHVAEIGEPFVTNNVENVVFYLRHPLLVETQSEMAVPIKAGNQVLGVLDIQEKPPRQFSMRQMNLMAAVADQLAVALQKANLYQDLQIALQQEKEMRSQLIRNERLILAGRLLASVSHELNNPLQAIQNALFLLKEEEQLSEQGKKDLAIILAETERMASLIGRLRATYRAAQAEDFQPTLLNELIQDVYALTSTYMRHKSIRFTFHPDLNLPTISVIPDKIRQVILNLVMNAIEAMPQGGALTVSTRYLPEQSEILMTFADTGPGINPAIQDRIFEPFVTDKETGTGLGLTITADIVQQHHGKIRAENLPTGGALFEVHLPCGERNDKQFERPYPRHR
ncbi:MAG: hypothetical protein DDG60_15205 [Anaerolineae bacterium]|nr:MAG: hypothetical protein DDG60_15205 [Anaerolineae bacterium]